MATPTPMFFGFSNRATYYYFLWLTANTNPSVDPLKLITEAIDQVPEDAGFQLGGLGISEAAARRLALALDSMIDDFVSAEFSENDDPPADGSTETLVASLAALALRSVNACELAEALMRFYGKWHPDNSPPEDLFPLPE